MTIDGWRWLGFISKSIIVAAVTLLVAGVLIFRSGYILTVACPEIEVPVGGWVERKPFSKNEVQTLAKRISYEECRAREMRRINQGWDTVFKVLILTLTIAGAGITATVAARKDKQNGGVPTFLLVVSAMLTASVGLMGTFAATTYNFAERQDIWDRKVTALHGCTNMLEFGESHRNEFLRNLSAIESWNDRSTNADLSASCTAISTPSPVAKALTPMPSRAATKK